MAVLMLFVETMVMLRIFRSGLRRGWTSMLVMMSVTMFVTKMMMGMGVFAWLSWSWVSASFPIVMLLFIKTPGEEVLGKILIGQNQVVRKRGGS